MAYEVARVHELIRSKFQELEAERGTKVALVDSEACSVPPQNKHQTSAQSQDSHLLLPDSQWSEMSQQASPRGCSHRRETKVDEEDHIMADLLDQITHSIIDDAYEEQFPNLETGEPNRGETSNSYTIRTPIHSSQVHVDMQVASPRIAAASPRAEPNLSSRTYTESVSGSKQCLHTDTSIQQFEASSPHSNSTRSSTSSSPRSRDEIQSQNGRSPRNEGSEWKQRKGWQGHGHGQHSYKGCGLKKAGRCQSLPRTGGMPGAVEWSGGAGMRAVFLRSESSKRESGGTGVFIPTSIGGSTDKRRKPACSIVLLPLRIIQVLNLNVENMRCHPAPLSRSKSARVQPSPMYVMELSPTRSKSQAATCSRTSQTCHPQQPSALSLELGLPTEWTY